MVEVTIYQIARDIVTMVGVLIGALYYVAVTRIQIKTRKAQLFLNLYNEFKSKEFMKTWTEIFFHWNWEDYNNYWEKYGPSDTEAFSKYMYICAYFEGIGLMVNKKLIDIDMVDHLMSAPIIWMWEKLENVTIGNRKRFNAPRIWEWNEYLYNELINRIAKRPLYYDTE